MVKIKQNGAISIGVGNPGKVQRSIVERGILSPDRQIDITLWFVVVGGGHPFIY